MILRGGMENLVPGKTIAADLVILIGRGHGNTAQRLSMINMKKVVIDSSVPSYEAVRLAAEINKSGIPCHYVGKDGAFVMKW